MVGVCEHCKSTYKYIGMSIHINGSTGVRDGKSFNGCRKKWQCK